MAEPVYYHSERYGTLLGNLLECNDIEKQIIIEQFQKHGLQEFFQHINEMNLSTDIQEKILAVKDIMEISLFEQGD